MQRRRGSCCLFLLALFFHTLNTPSHADSTAPGFKIVAQNITLPGRGQVTSQYTVSSVNGFAGKVAIVCAGPDPNLYPNLIMPSCAEPTQELTVPANGSIGGGIIFHPPWVDLTAHTTAPSSREAVPLFACSLCGFGLLGLCWRLNKLLFLALGVLCIGLSSAAVGCLGSGGLQMTPGTYIFALNGNGNGATATGKVTVTVVCNSCP